MHAWRLIVCSKNGTEMADIFVDSPEILYRVSKRKLLSNVPTFASFLDDTSTAHLPDIGCGEFDLLMEHIESGCTSIRPLLLVQHSEANSVTCSSPIPFFALAERFELPILQNLIMDTIIEYQDKNGELPSLEMARQSYQRTKIGSGMSKYSACGLYYAVQKTRSEDMWPTADLLELFHDEKTFAADFIDLVRGGEAQDPREMDHALFHTLPVLLAANPPSRKRDAESDAPSSQLNKKKRRTTNHVSSVDSERNETSAGRPWMATFSNELQLKRVKVMGPALRNSTTIGLWGGR
jgi:hypothetical protein